VVPFESLGTVSYSPSIVTMAVCLAVSEIFSVKQWRDLGDQVRGRSRSLKKDQVRGRSRSLKKAPFHKPYATFYSSAIVNIALSCILKRDKNYDDMLSRFHLVPERNGRTDGRPGRQTDRFAVSISRVSMLTRDKKNCARGIVGLTQRG